MLKKLVKDIPDEEQEPPRKLKSQRDKDVAQYNKVANTSKRMEASSSSKNKVSLLLNSIISPSYFC